MRGKRTVGWGAAALCAAMVGGAAFAGSRGPESMTAARSSHRIGSVRVVRSDAMDTRPMGRRPRSHTYSAASSIPLVYHGGNAGIGVSTGAPKVYLVFWGSQWGSTSTGNDGNVRLTGDPQNVAPRLESFFKGVGTHNEQWSGVVTQYCEGVAAGSTSCPAGAAHVGYPTSGAYAGLWVDTSSSAPSHANQNQLGAEAVAAAAHFNNVTPASNRNAQYVVVSPTGTNPDGFNAGGGFCAWHAYVPTGSGGSPYGPLAFTNMPYVPDAGWSCGAGYVNAGSAGALDGVTIVEGHEYHETLTDQTLGAWYDANGWENADRCAWNGTGGSGGAQNVDFGTGTFPVQASWSNDGASCRISHAIVGLQPSNFSISATAPQSVHQGASATSTIHTAITTGASVPVTLSASGVPTGVTASFDTNPVASGANATLTLATSYDVAPGRYSIVVTGTANNGATVTHSVTVSLTVTLGHDFSVGSASLSLRQGATGSVSVSTRSLTSDAASVALSTADVPSGIAPSFTTSIVTAGTNASMSVGVGPNVAPGHYTFHVVGTAASGAQNVVRTATVSLTITLGNDFSMTGGGLTVHRGASGSLTVNTRALFGATAVALSVDSAPAGLVLGWTSDSVNAGTSTTLTVTAASLLAPGRYAITVRGAGTSGGTNVSHTMTVYVTVLA